MQHDAIIRAMPIERRAMVLRDGAHGRLVEFVEDAKRLPNRHEYLALRAEAERTTKLLTMIDADETSILRAAAAAIRERRAKAEAALFDPEELAAVARMDEGDNADTIYRHGKPAPWWKREPGDEP